VITKEKGKMKNKKWLSGLALGTVAALTLGGLATAPAFAADPGGSSTGTGYNAGAGATPPTLTVSPAENLNPKGDSVLTLTGKNYATKNDQGSNFGGAYLLFGVINPKDSSDPGSWAPTKRGVTGTNYDYAPGAGSYQSLINYPGNNTGPGLDFMDDSGNFTTTLTIPGAKFKSQSGNDIDCLATGVQCGVITVGAHGQRSAGVEVFTPVKFAPESHPATAPTVTTQPSDAKVDEGKDATFTVAVDGDPAPTIQWQSRADSNAAWTNIDGATSATLTVSKAAAKASGTQYRAVATNTAGEATSNPATLTVNPSSPNPPASNASVGKPFSGNTAYMTVTPGKNLSTKDDNNLVIEGHGYDPEKPVYVGVGTILNTKNPEQWRKSEGGASGPGGDFDYGNPRLVVAHNSANGNVADAQMDTDGNWKLSVKVPGAKVSSFFGGKAIDCEAVDCGVFSFGAHGMVAAQSEAYTPIHFAKALPAPKFTVSPTKVAASGDSITVKGENIDTSAHASWDPTKAAGVYVSLGWISDTGWKPSEGAPSEHRVAVDTRWVQETQPTDDQYVQWTKNSDGTANFEFSFKDVDYDKVYKKKPAQGNYSLAVYTMGAGGVKQAVNEFSTGITIAAPAPAKTTVQVSAQQSGDVPTDFAGKDVKLSATVTPKDAKGSVEFFADKTSLGKADVADGVASLTTDKFTGGAHQVTAVFTPKGNFAKSTSGAQTFRIVDLQPAVGAISVGDKAKDIKDAEFTWSVANFVSFGAGPGKEVLSGNVKLVDGEFHFTGGTGKEDAKGNRMIHFEGDVRLTSGTLPEWNFRNPTVYVNASGDGYIEATIDGAHRLSMLGSEYKDSTYGPERAVVQTFKGAKTETKNGVSSFTVKPIFEGQVAAGTWSGNYAGATLTNQFLRHVSSFLRSYFLQSGSSSDATKAANPIVLAYKAGSAPTIATQPKDVTAAAGDDVTVSVGASAGSSIQWQQKTGSSAWANVGGATGAELALTKVELSQDGTQFRAVVSNPFGEVTSEAATLIVHPAGEPVTPEPTDENKGNLKLVSQDGLKVTLNAGAGNENAWIGVTLHADPQFLGWVKSDAKGNLTVTAPAGTKGEHKLLAVDANGESLGWVAVTFASADNGSGGKGNHNGAGNNGAGNNGSGHNGSGKHGAGHSGTGSTGSGASGGSHSGVGNTSNALGVPAHKKSETHLAHTGGEMLPAVGLALLLTVAGAATIGARRRHNA
jgi:hypothetical protein